MFKNITFAIVFIISILVMSVMFLAKVNAGTDDIMLQDALKQKQKLIVADFYTPWCGYCKKIAPTIHELQEEYKDTFIFVFVNGDNPKNQKYLEDFEITAFPTLYLINPVNESRIIVSPYSYGNIDDIRIELNKFLSKNHI